MGRFWICSASVLLGAACGGGGGQCDGLSLRLLLTEPSERPGAEVTVEGDGDGGDAAQADLRIWDGTKGRPYDGRLVVGAMIGHDRGAHGGGGGGESWHQQADQHGRARSAARRGSRIQDDVTHTAAHDL